jgi:hypothetical protein
LLEIERNSVAGVHWCAVTAEAGDIIEERLCLFGLTGRGALQSPTDISSGVTFSYRSARLTSHLASFTPPLTPQMASFTPPLTPQVASFTPSFTPFHADGLGLSI